MTKLLIRLFIKNAEQTEDPAVRSRYGTLAGVTGIICNVLLFAAKLIIGILSASLSITADAVNNLADASSSIMTMVGFHLSKKPADDEHPYGHARFEYLSGLGVAALILVIGFQLAKDSVDKILHPTPVEFSWALVVVLVLSIGVKLWMSVFNKQIGVRISSTALIATAADSRNDVISTAAVLAAALLEYFFNLSMDGYIGFCVALFILYNGVDIAKQTIKPLLGEPPDQELVRMVNDEIMGFDPRILAIHDLMVHDYGPGQRFASVHAEIDYNEDPMDAHELMDNIERMFQEKHRIHLVIHYDPVITDDEELNKAKAFVTDRLNEIDPQLSIHDFRMVRGASHTNLIFDMVVPKELEGHEKEIQRKLDASLQTGDMRYYTVITFDSKSFNRM